MTYFLTYLTDINVALHDGVVGGLVDTSGFHTNEGRLEEGLGASETLVTNGDDLIDVNYFIAKKVAYKIVKNTQLQVRVNQSGHNID